MDFLVGLSLPDLQSAACEEYLSSQMRDAGRACNEFLGSQMRENVTFARSVSSPLTDALREDVGGLGGQLPLWGVFLTLIASSIVTLAWFAPELPRPGEGVEEFKARMKRKGHVTTTAIAALAAFVLLSTVGAIGTAGRVRRALQADLSPWVKALAVLSWLCVDPNVKTTLTQCSLLEACNAGLRVGQESGGEGEEQAQSSERRDGAFEVLRALLGRIIRCIAAKAKLFGGVVRRPAAAARVALGVDEPPLVDEYCVATKGAWWPRWVRTLELVYGWAASALLVTAGAWSVAAVPAALLLWVILNVSGPTVTLIAPAPAAHKLALAAKVHFIFHGCFLPLLPWLLFAAASTELACVARFALRHRDKVRAATLVPPALAYAAAVAMVALARDWALLLLFVGLPPLAALVYAKRGARRTRTGGRIIRPGPKDEDQGGGPPDGPDPEDPGPEDQDPGPEDQGGAASAAEDEDPGPEDEGGTAGAAEDEDPGPEDEGGAAGAAEDEDPGPEDEDQGGAAGTGPGQRAGLAAAPGAEDEEKTMGEALAILFSTMVALPADFPQWQLALAAVRACLPTCPGPEDEDQGGGPPEGPDLEDPGPEDEDPGPEDQGGAAGAAEDEDPGPEDEGGAASAAEDEDPGPEDEDQGGGAGARPRQRAGLAAAPGAEDNQKCVRAVMVWVRAVMVWAIEFIVMCLIWALATLQALPAGLPGWQRGLLAGGGAIVFSLVGPYPVLGICFEHYQLTVSLASAALSILRREQGSFYELMRAAASDLDARHSAYESSWVEETGATRSAWNTYFGVSVGGVFLIQTMAMAFLRAVSGEGLAGTYTVSWDRTASGYFEALASSRQQVVSLLSGNDYMEWALSPGVYALLFAY